MAGTLAYIPDANYDGKDEFTFKVHDGTVFSKDAKVSIKIEKNEKLSRDQAQRNDKQQPNRERPSQSPSVDQKPSADNSNNNDTPPSDSQDNSGSPTQDAEQQKSDVKETQKQLALSSQQAKLTPRVVVIVSPDPDSWIDFLFLRLSSPKTYGSFRVQVV